MPASAISTASAAWVVPPGLVTFWRKTAGGSALAAASAPLPTTVPRAIGQARAAGRPALIAALARVSISRKT